MRPLLVGLDNPYSQSYLHALFPHPKGSAGERLWRMLREFYGLNSGAYVKRFDRINLYATGRCKNGKGATEMDRAMADWLLVYLLEKGYEDVVLLGQRVWTAFDSRVRLTEGELTVTEYHRNDGRVVRFWKILHPSGRNTKYNDREYRRATATLLYNLIAHEEN